MKKTVWLLSAYQADSHRAWTDWLVSAHPDIEWHRLALPGRHFRWRIRGNPLSWLDALPEETPDLIFASSMVDLATLKGLHPRLAAVPTYYYFHENQFAYPVSEQQVKSVEPQIVQLYGALAADRLLFNSAFNRDSFVEGVERLLARMPDYTPNGLRQRLLAKSRVLPIPIRSIPAARDKDPSLILWNHRWEYDKAPERFVEAMDRVAEHGVPFRLALLGPRPSRTPAALEHLRQCHAEHIVVDGRLEAPAYRRAVARAGIVVSTAHHEFQGLAMLEAASAGVRPLVPDALCYPEQYPVPYRYAADDRQALSTRLLEWLSGGLPPPVDVSPWYEEALAGQWAALLGRE